MSWRPLRPYGADIGLTAASLVVAASLCRLVNGGFGGPALGPLLTGAAVGSVVPAFLAARRVAVPLRVLVGTVAVALTALWTSFPGATTFGWPTFRTWHLVRSQLQAARPILRAFALPLSSTGGIILLGTLLVGLVSLIASVVLHSADPPTRLRPAVALLYPLALLTFAVAQTPTWTAALPLALFVVVAAATLSAARPAPIGAPDRTGSRVRWLSATTALTAAVVLIGTVLALSFGAAAGSSSGVSPGGGVARQVPPTGLSLTSSVVALEIHDAKVILFRAHSPYPTYWQVAVLNQYRNGVWAATPATTAAAHGVGSAGTTPAGLPVSAGAVPAFTASVTIADLSSHLLPVPPSTVAVSGPRAVTVSSEEAVTAYATRPGQQYSAIAQVPTNDPGALATSDAVGGAVPAALQADVALPPLPASIKALAEKITAGTQSPLSQAEALVNWFRSGKFHYTLHPPAPARGANPLVSFLTQTRAGTCEQFAGAYTVLARSLGLPTRLAVGFTAGHRTGPDAVTVRGSDAHAWPQVYLGGQAGWVSFEPTPQRLTGEVAPEGVVGPTGVVKTLPSPVSPPPAVGPTTLPPPTTAPTTTPTTTVPAGKPGATHHATPAGHRSEAWIVIIAAVLAALLGAILIVFLARRRRRSPVGRDPLEVTELAEREIDRALRRAGVARPPWRPLTSHLRHLGDLVAVPVRLTTPGVSDAASRDTLTAALRDAATAARFAELAHYAPDPVNATASAAAFTAAQEVRRGLENREVRRLLADAVHSGASPP